MHSVAEIILPPNYDIVLGVTQTMDYFREEDDETGQLDRADWWDFWKIGGRWSGDKRLAALDPDRLEAFQAELIERKVTVSAVRAGKPTLSPASQIPDVDRLWRERFPGEGDQCPLFAHSRDRYRKDGFYPDDVCRVADIPERWTCDRLIVAMPEPDDTLEAAKVYPASMLVQSFWNGVEWQETAFDGNVVRGLQHCRERLARGQEPPDLAEWQAVTVDYHN